MPDSNNKPIVLYIEDKTNMQRKWLPVIQEMWSPESQGARSRDAARELLESGFDPDVIIHDCEILESDDDDTAIPEAGDELYSLYQLWGLGDRVVVLTGSTTKLESEPYVSDRPFATYEKPFGEAELREMVERVIQ